MGCADSVEVGPKAVYAEFGHQLYAVFKSDGEVLWLHESDLPMFQPVLADGNIYYDSREEKPRRYHIRSPDASNGMLNWERMVTGPVTGSAEVYDGSVYYIVRGPVIDGHWEYTALLSLDASTGNPNWEYQVDKSITTSAVASGGNIYFGTGVTGGGYLYSIDAKSGELNRRYETEGRPYGTPLIAGGNAYIVSWSRSIYAMDLSTGEKDWSINREAMCMTPRYCPTEISTSASMTKGRETISLCTPLMPRRAASNGSIRPSKHS